MFILIKSHGINCYQIIQNKLFITFKQAHNNHSQHVQTQIYRYPQRIQIQLKSSLLHFGQFILLLSLTQRQSPEVHDQDYQKS